MTFDEAADLFLEALEVGRNGEGPIARATRDQYEWALDNYIRPELGAERLIDLTAPGLIRFRDKLLRSPKAKDAEKAAKDRTPLSRVSVSKVWKVLRGVLREATRRGLLPIDPLAGAGVSIRQGRDKPEVRPYHFHSLRHFYASTLIAAGATPKEVQVALGHASIDVTFDVYGHLFPEDRAARRARVNALASGLVGDDGPNNEVSKLPAGELTISTASLMCIEDE